MTLVRNGRRDVWSGIWRNEMRYVLLAFMLSGCAHTPRSDARLAGAMYGPIVGPLNISTAVVKSDEGKSCSGTGCAVDVATGTALHGIATFSLCTVFPPACIGYLAASSIYGAYEFGEHPSWNHQ